LYCCPDDFFILLFLQKFGGAPEQKDLEIRMPREDTTPSSAERSTQKFGGAPEQEKRHEANGENGRILTELLEQYEQFVQSHPTCPPSSTYPTATREHAEEGPLKTASSSSQPTADFWSPRTAAVSKAAAAAAAAEALEHEYISTTFSTGPSAPPPSSRHVDMGGGGQMLFSMTPSKGQGGREGHEGCGDWEGDGGFLSPTTRSFCMTVAHYPFAPPQHAKEKVDMQNTDTGLSRDLHACPSLHGKGHEGSRGDCVINGGKKTCALHETERSGTLMNNNLVPLNFGCAVQQGPRVIPVVELGRASSSYTQRYIKRTFSLV
jgi:hypothetical protein